MQIPGATNAWTMPIKARIDMLTTGMRTPVGIKIFGADLKEIEDLGTRLEDILRGVPGTRSVFAERVAGGYFVDFDIDRAALARFGLSVSAVQDVIMSAIGGENVTTTVEGRARFPVNVRYPRELRDNIDRLARGAGADALRRPDPACARSRTSGTSTGPSMIRNENGMLAGYVYVDLARRHRRVRGKAPSAVVGTGLQLPSGYSLVWSGQYENMLRVRERLKIVIPVTLVLIFALLYMNTKSAMQSRHRDARGPVLPRSARSG